MPLHTTSSEKELETLLKKRWESLPPATQTPNQMIGRTAVACGATHHVMEKCNFSCTCCYLGPEANKTEPLPFEEVVEQLDVRWVEGKSPQVRSPSFL